MTRKIRPLYDRILVRRVERAEDNESGLIMPDAAKERPREGMVIAVGKGRRSQQGLEPLDIAEGDTILFGKYAGTEVALNGEKLLMMREEEVMGVIE